MGLNIMDNRGVALDRQRFTWRDMVQKPISKLDDDAYSRVHIILLNGPEMEALRQHQLPDRCRPFTAGSTTPAGNC